MLVQIVLTVSKQQTAKIRVLYNSQDFHPLGFLVSPMVGTCSLLGQYHNPPLSSTTQSWRMEECLLWASAETWTWCACWVVSVSVQNSNRSQGSSWKLIFSSLQKQMMDYPLHHHHGSISALAPSASSSKMKGSALIVFNSRLVLDTKLTTHSLTS